MKVYQIEQRSPEWFALKLGRITGTRLKKAMAKDIMPLMDELAAEAQTGMSEEVFVNAAMQWGVDNEPLAIAAYEMETFQEVISCGFCGSDKWDFLGLSPDGWVGYDGAIEVKCPASKVHVKYIREDVIPSEYEHQVACYFLVNEDLEWLDFVSYDPRNKVTPLWIKRVTREELNLEPYISKLNEIALSI